MTPAQFITALVACLTVIGGGMAWAFSNLAPKADIVRVEQIAQSAVPASEFEKHLDNEESRYVLSLKQQIRDVQASLASDPDDEYLKSELQDMIDALCEVRPDDRLCT